MQNSAAPVLKVCEFYSGIGGYHLALSQIPEQSYKVVAAFEISSNANCIYRANFPATSVFETNLCGLTAARLESIIKKASANYDQDVKSRDENDTSLDKVMFVMSPPCQPFTRQGVMKDELDPRSESVIHLFDMFSDLSSLPDYFLLENVKGFETSNTRNNIMQFFTQHQYNVVEFLINSNQFGIPNSRLRYYLLARKQPFPEHIQSFADNKNSLLSFIPGCEDLTTTPPLSEFLQEDPASCQLSDKFLSKWGWVLDIVTPSSSRSCCFTKGYSVKAEGSGSVIQQTPDSSLGGETPPERNVTPQELNETPQERNETPQERNETPQERNVTPQERNVTPPERNVTPQERNETPQEQNETPPERSNPPSVLSRNNTENGRSMCNSKLSDGEFLQHMRSLNLRLFAPREIARIHGIPEWYSFPESLSEKQLYKLLGNGLNVTVVKLLIERILLS